MRTIAQLHRKTKEAAPTVDMEVWMLQVLRRLDAAGVGPRCNGHGQGCGHLDESHTKRGCLWCQCTHAAPERNEA